jgi:hypothetical protein
MSPPNALWYSCSQVSISACRDFKDGNYGLSTARGSAADGPAAVAPGARFTLRRIGERDDTRRELRGADKSQLARRRALEQPPTATEKYWIHANV